MTYHRQLLLRFLLYNGLAVVGLLAALPWLVQAIQAAPQALAIVGATFLFGQALATQRVLQFGRALDQLRAGEECELLPHPWIADYHAADALALLKLKLSSRVAPIRHIASSLVMLGLLGTVLGFIAALSGLDPARAADIGEMPSMVTTMVHGMQLALYATFTGGVLNIWLSVNVRLLEGAAARVVSAYMVGGR